MKYTGKLVTGCFLENTMTFEIDGEMELQAGKYLIIRVEEEELSPNQNIISTRNFENECELYVDTETDEWVFEHKGIIKKRSKSKFECLIAKKAIQEELGV